MPRGHIVPFPSRRFADETDLETEPSLTYLVTFSTRQIWAIECTIATAAGADAAAAAADRGDNR